MINITEDDNAITAELAKLRSIDTKDDSVVREPFRDIMKNVYDLSSYGIFEYKVQYNREMDLATKSTLQNLGYVVESRKIPNSFKYQWKVSWK